jgi:HAD superfamily hydrolase (TIGR01549 family)
MPAPDVLLFDLDDTLFDHRHSSRCGLDAIWREYPYFAAVTPDEFERRHSEILEELHARVLRAELTMDQARVERFGRLFDGVGHTPIEDTVHLAASRYRQVYIESRQPVPGAVSLLAWLRPFVRIAIITNNIVAEQVEKLEACGMTAFVDVLVASEEAGVSKPDPAIFEIALGRLGCSPEEALMIGDSWSADILGARAAGLSCVWFNRLGVPCPDSTLARELRSLEPAEEVGRFLLEGAMSEERGARSEERGARSEERGAGNEERGTRREGGGV